MEKERIVKREAKIEGIADKGYGLAYQYINRMSDLTIEAKGIYNYLSSLAGNGTEAFPSVSLVLSELGISKTRFYKHRELLLEKGLIRVEQGRAKYTETRKVSYDTSLYILLSDYDKIEQQKQRYEEEKNIKNNVENTVVKSHKKNRISNVEPLENTNFFECPQNDDTQNDDIQNTYNNNNSFNNNNFNNNNITTTIEKSKILNTKEIKDKNSSSSDSNINLDLKNITKTNIKKLKLNQNQIELLEEYVLNNEYDDIDKFSYFIAKSIKNGEITKDSLKTKSKKKKTKKNKVTTFEETKDQQLKSYKEAVELDNDNLTL